MKFLGVDTSGGVVSVCAVNGDKEAVRAVEGTTSVRLMDEIDGVLADADLKLSEVGFIACVVGPGSFTGIRIGIATVKGLCFALGKKAVALTSFDVCAYAEKNRSLCLVDAGHKNYYACAFVEGVMRAPEFLHEDALESYREAGYKFLSGKPFAVETEVVDIQRGLIEAAKAGMDRACGADALEALYLRKSSAEGNA